MRIIWIFITCPIWSIMYSIGYSVRMRKTDKSIKLGEIPGWWDFAQDCGYSDKWYKCGWCYVCTTPRWIPKNSDM